MTAAAAALAVLALAGTVWGVRAAASQILYFQSKYGAFKDNPERIDAVVERAHRLYPFNFYACIWCAETAYYRRFDDRDREIPERVESAKKWCRIGLDLNPYSSELRTLEVELLARTSLDKAIARWEEYVDWQFWEPYNHLVLVRLYCDAGRFGEAAEALAFTEGSRHHREARAYYREAWEREIENMRRFAPR